MVESDPTRFHRSMLEQAKEDVERRLAEFRSG